MIKKTPYEALYYSTVEEVTIAQIKAKKELSEVDVSSVEVLMDKHGIYGIVSGSGAHKEANNSSTPWPRRLGYVKPMPYLLYCQGELAVLDRPVLAVVGPRNLSPYGQQVLEELFSQLQHFDVITVSGMAPWADTLCHELSIQYGIPTVAILGGGFWYFLRGRKRMLMERIVAAGGLVISEYKHWQDPTSRTFPRRNRIIAGIADAVFLPEGKIGSGSLLTADCWISLGKPVSAPMGNIFVESSEGTNNYIAEWRIKGISNIVSFLEKYFTRVHGVKEVYIDLSAEESRIVELFTDKREVSVREMLACNLCGAAELMIHLSMLEMKWVICESSPGVYVKKVCNGVRKS